MEAIEIIYRLIVSILLGSIIGAERSFLGKEAGLRTFSLVTLGATLFSLMATYFPPESGTRILANIVLGIGFLGAGIIFIQNEKIIGATTAAALWISAGIGAAVGQGFYLEAFTATILTVIILALLPYFEKKIRKNE